MNKIKSFALCVSLLALFIVSACFKTPTSTNSRGSTTPDKTTTPTGDKSPQTSPSTKSGNYEQALNDYNSKNFDKAETGFKEVLQTEPNNANAHFYLGNIYYSRKDYQTSLPHFEQAAKIDFKSTEKLMALGDNQRELKQYDRAIVQYGKVTNFEPNNAKAYYAAGVTYIGLNNKIAARQQLQKLQSLDKSLADKLSKEIDGLK